MTLSAYVDFISLGPLYDKTERTRDGDMLAFTARVRQWAYKASGTPRIQLQGAADTPLRPRPSMHTHIFC